MTVPNRLPVAATPLKVTPASPLFLREDEIRRGIELLYFGYSAMIRGADAILEAQGLGRAHHRALYFIARRPGLSVGELLSLLGITKQSLGRVLTDLTARELVEQRIGMVDRRQRLLLLTPSGSALESRLFTELERSMARAYGEAGQQAVTGFWAVLMGLVPPADRAQVEALQG
jgi:DNA-binding MarR family transcriptional regulator